MVAAVGGGAVPLLCVSGYLRGAPLNVEESPTFNADKVYRK